MWGGVHSILIGALPMDCYLDVVEGLLPLWCEEGRPKAVRDKVTGKGRQHWKDQPLLLPKRRPIPLIRRDYIWEQKYGHGSWWGSTPRITMLANASSKLLLACSILITPVYVASRRATGWTAGVAFPAGPRCFSSYPVSTGGSFSEG
jgi:hypothetical protein